jgi:hypothetical protein
MPSFTPRGNCDTRCRQFFRAFDPETSGPSASSPDGLNDRVSIDAGLPRAEALNRPLENICEVELRDRAEANAPLRLVHEIHSAAFERPSPKARSNMLAALRYLQILLNSPQSSAAAMPMGRS